MTPCGPTVRRPYLVEVLLEHVAVGFEELLNLLILDDLILDDRQEVTLGVGEEMLREQRLKRGARVDRCGKVVAHLAVLRVGHGEAEHHEALEELVQLESAISALGVFADFNPVVGRALDNGVVDLVGALEDVDHARHVELLREDADVEGEVAKLGGLDGHRGVGAGGACGTRLRIKREHAHELVVR